MDELALANIFNIFRSHVSQFSRIVHSYYLPHVKKNYLKNDTNETYKENVLWLSFDYKNATTVTMKLH